MEKYLQIKEIGKVITGKTPSTEDASNFDGKYPFITPSDIKSFDEKYLLETERTLSEKGAKKLKNNILPKDAICVVCIGSTIGKMCLTNTIAYSNQQINSLIVNNNFDAHYMFYFLRYVKSYFQQLGAGTGSGKGIVNKTTFEKSKVKVETNKNIQVKIADILSAYDNLIENNNKRIKLLEQMAENLYKEWFVRFRFPGHEDVEFENGLPKNWEKVQLDDVLNKIATGLNPRKNFVLGEGENFYVTIKNMADNTVYLDDKCDKVNDDAIIRINKRSDLKIGDLLFSGIGTIGRVCLIDIPTNDWNISESIFTMRANKKISSEFLYMLLLSQDVQNYCQSKANGSAQKGIRMGDLRKYAFLLPTKNVINDFTSQISPILRNVSLLRNKNKNLIAQRDLLLPRLMSGKLKV